MKATAVQILASLRQVRETVQSLGILLDSNDCVIERVADRQVRLTWATSGVRPDLTNFVDSSVEEYLTFVTGRHYTLLLNDGALIQMSYDVERTDEVVGSRLVWYPCPADVSPADLEYATLDEIVLTTPTVKLGCRAPVRMDFAPRLAAENHSATHLHLGFEKTRVPVQRGMEPMRFLGFILRTAYPELWGQIAKSFQCADWSPIDSLSDEDRQRGALSWVRPA